MDSDEAPSPPKQEDNTTALFLGLYLLILAFFILLVSISTLEDVKSKSVMDSLSSTFSTLIPPSTELSAFTSKEGETIAGQPFQEKITGVFASTLQVAKVEVVQPGRLMRIEVPASALFEPNSATLREVQRPLLDRIVAVISARPPGIRYDMEFIIGTRYAPGTSTMPITQTLEMARAGSFARELLSRGIPPDSIAVGVKPGDPEDAAIWYYIRDVEESKLQFGETVGERWQRTQEVRQRRRRPEPEPAAPAAPAGTPPGAGVSIPLPTGPIRGQ